ncbi:MAG: serine hydrolase [Cyclobacteriaceae bacterium]
MIYNNRRTFVFIIFLTVSVFLNQSCTFSRLIAWNFAGQEDIERFPANTVKSASSSFDFTKTEKKDFFIDRYGKEGSNAVSLDDFIDKFNHNLAFLVIKNDSILFEKYASGYSSETNVTTFSVSKSIVSMLVGIALEDGYIESLSEPITKYLPELKKDGFEKITIEHLLKHTSGIRFKERYVNPFNNDVARYYYGKDVNKAIDRLKIEHAPGDSFHYHSANTQLLGLILIQATGQSISEYFSSKIWSKIGTKNDASWSTYEKQPTEKTFCCFNSTVTDLAKFGKLLIDDGTWNEEQLISKDWIDKTHERDIKGGSIWGYQYHMILGLEKYNDFMAQGLYDQYLYMMPEKDIIIVSINETHKPSVNWRLVFLQIVDQL